MDLLRRPWMVETLKAAFGGRPEDRISTPNGELGVSRTGMKKFVQLIRVESLDPVVAVLTDKDVSVTAEFTDSFISRFDKERGKPLTQFSKAVFQLERYEFVFCGSDAALFVNGGTFKDQLIGRYTGGGKQRQDGSPQPRPKCTVELRLIVDSMTYQSGEGNPIFGSPKNVGKHPDIRELMGRLPVKESLLPARSVASTEPKPPVTSRKGSVKKKCEDLEFASDLSSQPFATQAVGMPHPSEGEDDEDDEDEDGDEDEGGVDEDDDSSLASQQLVSESEGDDSDGSIFATQAHQLPARKSSKPSLSSPDSSSNTPSQSGADRISVARGKAHKKAPDDEDDDKLDSARVSTGTSPARKAGHQSSLHPGWKGITEVPAEFATIPEDQEKLLDEPGSWWPSQDVPNGLYLQTASRLHPLRVRTVITTETGLPRQLFERQPQSESESSADDEAIEWPTSPPEVRDTTPDLDRPPSSSPGAPSSPLHPHNSRGTSEPASRQTSESPVPAPSGPPVNIEGPGNGTDAKAVTNDGGPAGDETDDGESSVDDTSTADRDSDIAAGSKSAGQQAVEERPTAGDESEADYESAPKDKAEHADESDIEHAPRVPIRVKAADEPRPRETARKQAYSGERSESVKETLGSGDDHAVQIRITRAVDGITNPRKLSEREEAFKRVRTRALGSVDQNEYSPTPPPARSRESSEPPIPIRDPFGMTPDVKNTRESDSTGESVEGYEDKSGSDDGGKSGSGDKLEKNPPSTPHAFEMVVPFTTTVGGFQQPTHDASDEDEDIPSAPAVPLGQRTSAQESTAKKGTGVLSRPPPSTVRPVIQVKETPYRRPSSASNAAAVGRDIMSALRDPDDEEMIPVIHDQQSSMETREDEPERQLVNLVQTISTDSTATQESHRDESFNERMEKADVSDHDVEHGIEVPRTQFGSSAKPQKSPKLPPKRTFKRVLKSADLASQGFRNASLEVDASSLLAEQRRQYMEGEATVEDHVSKPSAVLGATKLASSTDLPRKRFKSPSGSPIVTKKARMDTTSTDRHYAPSHASSSPLQSMPRTADKPKSPPPKATDLDADSDIAMADEPAASSAPVQTSHSTHKTQKRQRSGTSSEVDAPNQRASAVSEPPKPEVYAGFRPRTIAVPGYEDLDEERKLKLEERRRLFFGTHRPIAPFVATPSEEADRGSRGKKKSWQSAGSCGDKWWLDEDTPMRKFVKRFKDLKAVKRELGNE